MWVGGTCQAMADSKTKTETLHKPRDPRPTTHLYPDSQPRVRKKWKGKPHLKCFHIFNSTYFQCSWFYKFDCDTQAIPNNVHAIIIFTQQVNSGLHTAADEEEPFTSVQPPLSSLPFLVFNLEVFFSLIFFFCLPLSSGPFSLHRKKTASVNSSNQCLQDL